VELLFGVIGLIPAQRSAKVMTEGITWNYTTWLNITFLILAAVLVARFVRTGGLAMLPMMGGSPDGAAEHDHSNYTGHPHRRDEKSVPPSEHHVGHDHDGQHL
jgi:uncharacterized protein